ncbi:MAG: ABC transporter ATP-binding protein, partial [Aminivibrio sp.]
MAGVELRSVTKRFGKTYAVRDVSLSVEKGEFLSLVGPSGCGKTTTLRLVAGFLNPDSGDVLLDGQSVKTVSARQRQVGIVFQSYALFPNLTVFENVAFGLRTRKTPEEVLRSRVDELLSMVGLADRATSWPRELSGGQQQRVALARALAITPRVLLMDEPLSALDAKVRNALRFEIKRIQRESGITAIYVTHDQEEALSISDRVALMNDGQIEQTGAPGEIYLRPANPFVADFVGVNNLLKGEYLGEGRFKWKDRVLEVENAPLAPGSCLLMIRPERMTAISAGRGEAQGKGILGRVSGKVFLGPLIRLAVESEGVQLL